MREYSCVVGKAVIYVEGFFLFRDMHGETAAKAFLTDFLEGKASFDDLMGAYLVRIELPDASQVFFSDNSGMRRFYINRFDARFERTFTDAMPKVNRMPNYDAIAQFLYFGCIYANETIEESVILSNPDIYYEVREKTIHEHYKNLQPLNEIEFQENQMEALMYTACKALSDYKNCFCTITGGIDSRSVLAHLLHANVKPTLDITGNPEDVDVMIAKEIAEKTGLELLKISDAPEEDWVDDAITAASMGMVAVCGGYRLYKKAKRLQAISDVIECGGFAGELYKNSFINQDFPLYVGKPNWNKFIKYKVMTYDFPKNICEGIVKKEITNMGETLIAWLQRFKKQKKQQAYLSAGYAILQQRSAGIFAMEAQHYIAYSPLLERKLATYGFHKSPYALEMQSFQRHQVSRYYPALKDIRTDRGLSCNYEKMISEWMKSTLFLVKIGLQRYWNRGKENGRIDSCFQEGLHSSQYKNAFEKCKEMGILAANIYLEDVPESIADRVFLVGSVL